jgi:glycosyltransferase involved in cell wall biosynthesis
MPKSTPRLHFAVYVNSIGNYFFAEFQELFATALRELGIQVTFGNEKTGFLSKADWHLVIAPHEFFHTGRGILLRHRPVPKNLILYVTDPPESKWFRLARMSFAKAHAVWCIDPGIAAAVTALGYRAFHVPLGFSAKSRLFRPVKRLPRRPGVDFVDGSSRGPNGVRGKLASRPFDYLFVGGLTDRRDRFFARHAQRLSRWRGYMHLVNPDKRARPGETTHFDTTTALGLAQRSKIVLNLHREQSRFFEWHRMVVHGLGQKALVVSEPGLVSAPLKPGRDFLEAPMAKIPALLDSLLGTAAGRRRAQAIAERGFKTLQRDGQMANFLKPALNALADPAPEPAKMEPPRICGSAEVEVLSSGGHGRGRADVTVAVTLHNYREFILEALNSVRGQTLRALDLLIVDDRSTDGSCEVAKRWLARHGRRFRRYELSRAVSWSGLARVRNAGFSRARTPFVFVLDADNVLFPSCLERLAAAMRRGRSDFAYSYLRMFGEDEALKNVAVWGRELLCSGYSVDAMAMVRRSTWRRLQGYRSMQIQGWEDYDFWLRLERLGGQAAMVPEVLSGYRVHMRSMSNSESYPQAWRLEDYFAREFGVEFRAGAGQAVEAAFTVFGSNRLPPPVKRGVVETRGAKREEYMYKAMSILDELNKDLRVRK